MRNDRKYRRRRLGALLVVAAAGAALYAGGGASAGAPSEYHTVSAGDTLWYIATDHYTPAEDPRPWVAAIREANGLPDSTVHPGMRLELPAER